MKYISELAYASHIAQTNRTARDKKQKNKYQQSELLVNDLMDEFDEKTQNLIDDINASCWDGEDRRVGNDRRETSLNRGRYLESRAKKDRRYSAELYVKI